MNSEADQPAPDSSASVDESLSPRDVAAISEVIKGDRQEFRDGLESLADTLFPDHLAWRKRQDRFLAAAEFACYAHTNQRDKSGEPYLFHVHRVGASLLPDVAAATVGLLHDVLEDCPGFRAFLRTFAYPEEYEALLLLSRAPNTSYQGYILRIAANPLARKVKLADLADNLRPDRLAAARAAGVDVAPLVARYMQAQKVLLAAEASRSPAFE